MRLLTICIGVAAFSVTCSRCEAVPPITCDYNRNGVCDTADYVLWRDTLQQTGSNLPADGNQSGVVDAPDYIIWRAGFGQAFGSGSGSALVSADVPEPSTLLSAILVLGAGALRRPVRAS